MLIPKRICKILLATCYGKLEKVRLERNKNACEMN
jgi:hypothetical protein